MLTTEGWTWPRVIERGCEYYVIAYRLEAEIVLAGPYETREQAAAELKILERCGAWAS
jgi:hypothetical protein